MSRSTAQCGSGRGVSGVGTKAEDWNKTIIEERSESKTSERR